MEGIFAPSHLLIVAIVLVALFGYKKLPEVTRSVGKSLRIFKTEMKGLSADDEARENATDSAPAAISAPIPTAPTSAEIARAQAVLAAAAQAGPVAVVPGADATAAPLTSTTKSTESTSAAH